MRPLLLPLEICPLAPPGMQTYVDQITGYVLFGVGVLFVIGVVVSIGAILAGKIFAMPHASKAGVVGVAVVILAAVAYQIFPAIVAAIVGTGCVG